MTTSRFRPIGQLRLQWPALNRPRKLDCGTRRISPPPRFPPQHDAESSSSTQRQIQPALKPIQSAASINSTTTSFAILRSNSLANRNGATRRMSPARACGWTSCPNLMAHIGFPGLAVTCSRSECLGFTQKINEMEISAGGKYLSVLGERPPKPLWMTRFDLLRLTKSQVGNLRPGQSTPKPVELLWAERQQQSESGHLQIQTTGRRQ